MQSRSIYSFYDVEIAFGALELILKKLTLKYSNCKTKVLAGRNLKYALYYNLT